MTPSVWRLLSRSGCACLFITYLLTALWHSSKLMVCKCSRNTHAELIKPRHVHGSVNSFEHDNTRWMWHLCEMMMMNVVKLSETWVQTWPAAAADDDVTGDNVCHVLPWNSQTRLRCSLEKPTPCQTVHGTQGCTVLVVLAWLITTCGR